MMLRCVKHTHSSYDHRAGSCDPSGVPSLPRTGSLAVFLKLTIPLLALSFHTLRPVVLQLLNRSVCVTAEVLWCTRAGDSESKTSDCARHAVAGAQTSRRILKFLAAHTNRCSHGHSLEAGDIRNDASSLPLCIKEASKNAPMWLIAKESFLA